MQNGSLDRYLFNKSYTLGVAKLHEIAIGTARGLAYLHEECDQKIVHYDIKPANILLDASFSPKVADFGLAKLCNRDSTHVTMTEARGTQARGTPGYAAPEMWMDTQLTHKCDVYSFGMLLFELVGRRRNYLEESIDGEQWFPMWVWRRLEGGEMEKVVDLCGGGDERERIVRMCMAALWCAQYQAEARPPMSEVVKMLEGEMVISPPLNPFQHLMTPNIVASDLRGESDSIVSTSC